MDLCDIHTWNTWGRCLRGQMCRWTHICTHSASGRGEGLCSLTDHREVCPGSPSTSQQSSQS